VIDPKEVQKSLEEASWIDKEEEHIVQKIKEDHMNDAREYRYQKDWNIDGEMFHVRCDEWDVFQESVKNMESIIPSNGNTPIVRQPVTPQPDQQTVQGNCPKCGSPLIEAKKKDGTTYIKCSTNKWDKFKKVATGCDYVNWGE